MRTVYPNPRVVIYIFFAFFIGCLFFIFFFIDRNFSLAISEGRISRDLKVRQEILKQLKIEQEKKAIVFPKISGEREKVDKRINLKNVEDEIPKENEDTKEVKNEDIEEVKDTDKKEVLKEPPKPNNEQLEDEKRREKIVEMITHAWDNYKNYTWGANELRPISKQSNSQGIFGGPKMMATIVDSADTLYITGLKSRYEEARDYIRDNFNIKNAISYVSVFEITIRYIGGFLTLYALTKEQFYIDKAKEIADSLLIAFETKTGIPKASVNVHSNTTQNYGWTMNNAILSEAGSLHLEFVYLSKLTGNPIYENKVKNIRNVMEKAKKTDGLYSVYISTDRGQFVGDQFSLGALGDSFYEYLIKSWVHTKDQQAYRMYKEVSKAIQKHLLRKSKQNGLFYLGERKSDLFEDKMSHLSCFVPGMFALEAEAETDPNEKSTIMNLAEELGHTCHESYTRSKTGIGPEIFYFNDEEEATTHIGETGYILRPEAIEGWFYLWRLTGKKKYKEWIWNAVKAIDKYCRVENGFVGLKDVYRPEKGYDDVQQTFLLAETLKYAYLTFDDNALPLDKWVFNTEAHPFPIQN